MTDNPLFVQVVTRSDIDPDQPADRKRINLHNPASQHWLTRHIWSCLHSGRSVTVCNDD